MRALRLVEQALGRALPVALRIEKRIPVGGGLGGGSSDAAAVLVGIRDLLSLSLTDAQLASMSHWLGSDVAYFIGEAPPAPALVTGLGDRVERLPRRLAGGPIILVIPSFGCPTAQVYKAFDQLPRGKFDAAEVAALARGSGGDLFNHLLPAAERVEPRLAPLRDQVARLTGLPVHMSGSGSTLFVLPPGDGVDVAAKIATELSDVSVFSTRLL